MITSEGIRRNDYTGNGVQTAFPYTFKIFATSDLLVYDDATLLTLGTHYSVSGAGVDTGGTVTLAQPLISTHHLTILSAVPAVQETHFQEGTRFPAAVMELLADRLVALYQQGRTDQRRTLALALLSTFANLTLPDPVALRALRWKSDLSGLENFDPTTGLPIAATLPLSIVLGGSGASTVIGARQAYGLDGQLPRLLTNRTGGSLVLGDVVTLDSANDSAVVLDDTVSSKSQFYIALESIAALASGAFLLAGVSVVNVAGPVIRGRYLRKATATKAAEDAGALQGPATDPPQGSFAVALTGDVGGQVVARLLGATYPGSTAPVITALPRVWGLVAGNTGGSSPTQVDVSAVGAVLRDPVGGGTLVLPAVALRTADVTVAGPAAGGRDQATAFLANTWLHLYLIARPDATYHVTWSAAAPPTGPALPTGYTLWGYCGAVRLNNATQLVPTRLRGANAQYEVRQNVLDTATSGTTEQLLSFTALVPPTAARYTLGFSGVAAGAEEFRLRLTTGNDFYRQKALNIGDGLYAGSVTVPNVSQQISYITTVSRALVIDCQGYENPVA